jgi:hypothetical protein
MSEIISEFIWPLTALAVSAIWARAWVVVEGIKYEPDSNGVSKEELDL